MQCESARPLVMGAIGESDIIKQEPMKLECASIVQERGEMISQRG